MHPTLYVTEHHWWEIGDSSTVGWDLIYCHEWCHTPWSQTRSGATA